MDEQALRGLALHADSRSHQRAIAYFEQLKSSPDGWQLCTQTLAHGSYSDNNVKFFCFQVLEHKIRHGYEQLGRECHVLRQSLLSWLQAQTSRPEAEPKFVRNKATQVMALLFIAEFPEVGPSLLDEVLRIVGLSPAGVDLYLRLLLAIDGELVDRDILHTAQEMRRSTTVKDGMRERSIPRLVESWLQILYTFQASNAELACLCLEVVGAYVSWIDINLIANERFISLLLGHMSVDVLRESACDCLLEIVSKGMEPRDKIELVESLSQVLEAAGFYNLQQNEDGDFLAHFSKLLCAMGQALLQSWARFGKAGAAPEAAQALDAARAKLPVMLGLLGHSDDDISLNCCGFCYDYLHTLKQLPDVPDLQKADVEAILLAIIKKLTYDEDFNFDNEGEEEVMFLDYRKQLKLLLDKVAQVAPNLLLLSVHRVVTGTLRDWKDCAFGEVELALRLLYLLGEALPAGHCGHFSGDESKASVLQDMVRTMVLSGVSHYQHCAVTLQFFETVVRYDKFFSAEPQHIPEVLVGFLDCRGLRHPNAKVRSRCSYLLSRFVKSLSKQIMPFVEEILCQVQDLLVLSPRVNGLQPALSGEDQLFLYEMAGYLVACGELAVGRKTELLGSLLGPLTAAFPPLLARLSAETDEDRQAALAESLAHAVSFVSRTSKAFSSRATVRECGCADVYVACLSAFLPALACPLQRDSIRAALRSFLHRMLVCLDVELLPYLPAALQAMLSRGDTRDVLDAIPLLNQLVGKFKVQVQPLVREVFPVVLTGISGGLRLPVEENDQSAALEKQSIRRAYYTFMLALLTNGLGSIISDQGDMNKTAKSTFMEKLEALGTAANNEPDSVDAYLIDAMFFIRTLPPLPSSFGGVARSILQRVCTNAKTVHLICDTYPDGPSIKDQEHDNRGCSLMHSYKITGPLQKRPADFQNALKSADFKRELLSFLKDEWVSSSYASILEGHKLYYATGQECFLFTSNGRQVERITVNDLGCTHEEADTRLVFHANFVAASEEMPGVVVRSIDTDVFILLLYHAKYINAKLWMDAGVNSKNTRRLIDISGLAENLTPVVCEALPSFHAFTGCDFTAAFMRKAKSKPYEIMVKNERFVKALSMLGTSDTIDVDVAATLEEYVCCMYGLKNAQRTNDARLQLFKKLYAPKKQSDPLEKIKSSDPCCLPPCRAVLEEKLKRTNHVAFIWKNACSAEPVGFGPIGHGWKVDDNNRLAMVWFECPQVPRNLSADDLDLDDEDDGTLTPSLSSDEEESDDE